MNEVLQLLIHELKPYKWRIVWSSILAAAAAGFDTLAPILLGRGFDAAGQGVAMLTVSGLLFAWFAVRTVGEAVRSHISRHGFFLANEIADSYVRRTAVSLIRKPLTFHYGKKSQESSDALHEMRWTLDNLIGSVVFDLLPALIAMASILGYVAWLDWRIAVSLGVSSIVLIAFTYGTTPQVMRNQTAWMTARRKSSSAAWDAIRNALVVKSTSNEEYVTARVERFAHDAVPLVVKDFDFDRFVRDGQNLITGLGSFAAVYFAVLAFRDARFTFGQLTSVVAFTFAIFGYVRYCQWQARHFIRLSSNFTAVRELLAVPDEDYDSGRSVTLSGAVEFRSVRFRYREDKPTIEDVSFVVAAGERVAIVGESGVGKTTLFDLLGRYYLPQSGAIFFDGVSSSEINLRSLRAQMAYVPQDLTLFHETIGYNIRYGRPDASEEDLHHAARQASLEDFINGLPDKWETVVGERGLKLSGGERQRVALARAFLRDPKILVLDEPTSHLDSVTEGHIQRALETLMKGRTTFIIAHRLRTVMDADRILVLKDGRIVETGKHAELVARGGAYAALIKAQGGFVSTEEKHLGDAGVE